MRGRVFIEIEFICDDADVDVDSFVDFFADQLMSDERLDDTAVSSRWAPL